MPSPSIVLDSFATFGDLLKFLRRRARLTQLEFSIVVGYSESQISRLEKNQRPPELTALKALFIPALHLENEPEIVTRLLALAESARQEDAPIPGFAPYKGLLFFDEADTDLFFGRETLTAHLVERVRSLAQHCPRLLAIVGASGSGKSSVVRAGLAVAMKRTGWETRVLTPTAQPLKMLEANLAHENVPLVLIVDQFEEVFTLCRDETARAAFIEKLLALANEPNGRSMLVLALRADFYSHCAQYPHLRQALATNQEYIGQMTREELRCAIEEPAKRGEWEFEPGLVDLMLSDVGAGGAQDQEPGALPLLSHALLATWEHRRGRTFTLAGYRAAGGVQRAIAETAESVFTDQLNQAQQHLARDIFLRLTELGEGTEDTRRRAGLTELVPSADQATQLRAVLNTLAEARLVMLGVDSAEVAHEALIREWLRLREWLNENREGLRLHRHLTEAAQSWDKLNRDAGELYRGARLAQALEWASTNEEPLRVNELEREFLSASRQMREREEAEREAQRQRELVAAQKLAESSQRLAEAERRRANISRWAAIASTILLVVMIGLAVFASSQRTAAESARVEAVAQRDAAENERRIAFVRELSVNAVNNLTIDPERSILLALQAVSVSSAGGKPVLRDAEDALHRAVQASRVQLTLRGHTATLNGIAYSPDGKRLATASTDKSAKVWDAATGKELLTLCCHDAAVWSIAFSPDGTRVATASLDKTAKIWDAETGKELLTLVGHTGGVYKVVYSPDGTRLATSSWSDEAEHTAKVWDATSGKVLLTLKGHTGRVSGIAFSPDGKRVATAGDDDETVKIWDSVSGQLLITVFVHSNVQNVAFSPDLEGTRLATSSNDGMAKVWDAATGELLLTLAGHTSTLQAVAFSPDGMRLATASADTTAKVWDITPAGSREWLTLSSNNRPVKDIAYSPDGSRLATASVDKTAKIWDALTGKLLLTLSGHTSDIPGVTFSPDGSRVATVSIDQTAKIWDAATGKQLLSISTLIFTYNFGLHTTFSPDGQRIATPGAGATAKVWDTATGKELLTLCCHADPRGVRGIAFSPDGTRLATGGFDNKAKVWDAATGKELLTLSGHTSFVWALTFSPDGRRIATAGGEGTAKVWDAVTGEVLLTLSGYTGSVTNVAFSPDGMRLAAAASNGMLKIWDVSPTTKGNEQPLTLYNPTGAGIGGIAISHDGKRVAASSDDGTVRIYALPLEDIVAIAKSRVTRTLTTDECQKFLHTDQCPADQRLGSAVITPYKP